MKSNEYLTSANFSIIADSFSLIGVKESDLKTLHAYESERIFNRFCLNRTNPLTGFLDYKERFKRLYTKQRQLQFIIKDCHNKDCGTMFTSKKGAVHRHSFFCVYLTESVRNHLIGWHATAVFLRYMFEQENMLKLYTEIMEDNVLSLRCAKFLGMVEEGYYPIHYVRSDGQHVGVHFFALYPSTIDINPKKYRIHKPYKIVM